MARMLISGAGIAGCCLAWWLQKDGAEVTLVEQAPEPRRGGYVLDFWGLGYKVAEKMGLLAGLRQHDLEVEQFRIVDRSGRRISGIDQGALQGLTGGRIMSLQRSAVAAALYEAVRDRVDIRFDDGVAGIEDGPQGVDVQFRAGGAARFDLVFGADGLHSAVRAAAFGAEESFERFVGYYVAAFTTTGYPHRDPHAYVTYGEPGRQIWRITIENDATVFLLVFAEADPNAVPMHDTARQKDVLARRYADCGWETKEVLGALETATDLYFDRVSQIVMPRWTSGRIALLGDACACPSLLAGEGSSMAMAEAYTLAGELHAAPGDHLRAFAAYEQRLRPYVERKQKAARGFAASFVPTSAIGLWLRNFSIDAVGRLGLTRMLFGAQLNDDLQLGDYR
ncbi:MAG TPA: FAD-binding domain [Devosia sp.]|nr:FAD-binding domain [Devosia sp.]